MPDSDENAATDQTPPEPQSGQNPYADLPQPSWEIVEKGGKSDDHETR